MAPIPSATRWGSPNASRRAFLIHGNTCSSHTWERVAQGLVQAGFLVTAPNMLGHGNRPAEDFHVRTFAQDLYSTYFDGDGDGDGDDDGERTKKRTTYDLIVAHSFGGTVALALLPLLSAPAPGGTKTAVVLVDPGIEFDDDVLDAFTTHYANELRRVPTVEEYMADNPTWTRQDAVSRVVGLYMAQSEVPRRVFEHIRPFAYRHLFDAIPAHVEMTVLVADPELSRVCPPDLVPSGHPQIQRVVTVKGTSHWIQYEDPDVIVRTAVDEVERLRAA